MILPGRGRDDVDRAEACPHQREAEHRDDRRGDRAADRRRRRLDDLERRRQEGELVVACALGCAATADRSRLTDFMDACLQAMQLGVAPAGADQLVVRAVLDDPAALDGDDAVGACARSTAGGR